jgi:hypothetical protein
MSVNEYQIFCVTESTFKTTWGQEPPTSCPTDTAHTINENSITTVQTINPNTVYIETDKIPTGGNFRVSGYMKYIPLGTTGDIHTFDQVYPFPINLSLVAFTSDSNSAGDVIYADVSPDTVIGVNTAEILGTTGIINVNETVLEYLKIGYMVDVFTGVTSYELGRCLSINLNESTILTENTVPVTVAPGNYIRMSIRNIDCYCLSNGLHKTLGAGKIGAAYIPANTVLRLTYKNNNGEAKRFWIDNEYTY